MSRVPLLDIDGDHEVLGEVARSFQREGRVPIDLHRTLAHAPEVLAGFHSLSDSLRYRSDVPRSVRELVILRTAQLTGSGYEWAHHVGMARKAGATDTQIEQLAGWRDHPGFDAATSAALAAAEEIHQSAMSDETFRRLEAHYSERGIVELVVCIAHYQAVARIIQALDVQTEPEYAGPPAKLDDRTPPLAPTDVRAEHELS